MASPEMPRPRGRRPGHDDTKGTIRTTAARLFHEHGYDKVSLRAVAREAGVDPALIHHYFTSKADLFTQAVLGRSWEPAEYVADILTGPDEQVGRRAARLFLNPGDRGPYEAFLAALAEPVPTAARATTEMIAREVLVPVAAHFGHSNTTVRAHLAAATLVGMLIGRDVLRLPAVASGSSRSLATPLGVALQGYLVDDW